MRGEGRNQFHDDVTDRDLYAPVTEHRCGYTRSGRMVVALAHISIIFPIRMIFKSFATTYELGAAVRAARKAQNLRQEELAGVAGVGTRFVIELEAGKPTIQLGKAMAVLAALGLMLSLDGLEH